MSAPFREDEKVSYPLCNPKYLDIRYIVDPGHRACAFAVGHNISRLKLTCMSVQRFLLAEVIKTSPISLDLLLRIVKENNIQPDWNEIFIPTGKRSNRIPVHPFASR